MKKIEALLFMDSSDFVIERQRGRGRKSEHWSGKLSHPARRFQFTRNSRGNIIKAWGGYSPKIMDQVFLDFKRYYIERVFKGADIVGDTHFAVGKKLFKEVTFWTPEPEPKETEDEDAVETLPKKQRKLNNDIHKVRARVEHPFATMKTMFKSLATPWREEIEQLDCAVWTAIGVYNLLNK